MVIRPNLNWFQMLFAWRGSVLPRLIPRLLIIFAVSILVTINDGAIGKIKIPLTLEPFTLLGVSLAIFLGFRNSASYERWWEGRRLWGQLLNTSRSLARQSSTLTGLAPNDPLVLEFNSYLIAFAHALRHQLRSTHPAKDLATILTPDTHAHILSSTYRPPLLIRYLAQWTTLRRKDGSLPDILQPAIDANLNQLSDIVGGCERIASTPIPFGYSLIIHRMTYLYCLFLPFGLVDRIHALTPVVATFIAYTFMALEALASELEDPFGTSDNDLALNAMCHNIESSIRELTDQPFPPDPPTPKDFVLN